MKSNCWTQSSLARESAHEFAFLKMYRSNFHSNEYTRLLLTYFISTRGFQKHSPSINGSLHYCLYHDRFEKKIASFVGINKGGRSKLSEWQRGNVILECIDHCIFYTCGFQNFVREMLLLEWVRYILN